MCVHAALYATGNELNSSQPTHGSSSITSPPNSSPYSAGNSSPIVRAMFIDSAPIKHSAHLTSALNRAPRLIMLTPFSGK